MNRHSEFGAISSISPKKPLFGVTILAVEDSRFTCDALRLLCLKSGARLRRADSIEHAKSHLKTYRPSVLLVDIGLPDGDGTVLIQEVVQSSSRIDVVLGMSGDDGLKHHALGRGADGFIAKPISSLYAFQAAILEKLPQAQSHQPYIVDNDTITVDPIAYRDDLSQISKMLHQEPNGDTIRYAAQFTSALAKSAEDNELFNAAHQLSQKQIKGPLNHEDLLKLSKLVDDKLEQSFAL